MSLKYKIGDPFPVLPAKDPDGVLDYAFEWNDTKYGPWLQTGETILTSTWVVTTGISVDSDIISGTQTIVFISGGTSGKSYRISNTITTSDGRTTVRSAYIPIQEL